MLNFRRLGRHIYIGQIIISILSLWLIGTSAVLAAYLPPSNQKPAPKTTRSDSGTTRGCRGNELPPTVLASRKFIGQTTSTHPTFAWFVADAQPVEIKFTIYEVSFERIPQAVYHTSLQSSPGVMILSPWSKNKPGLEFGKTYFWQVVIICDPSSPSSALFDRAHLEVVPPSAQLQKNLDKASSSNQKVERYAEAGIWYDALAEALKLAPFSKLGEIGANLLQSLANSEISDYLRELDPQEKDTLEKRSENLRAIATLAN